MFKLTEFELASVDSNDKPIKGTEEWISILWNDDVLSFSEVEHLIHSGKYKSDNRVIVTTRDRIRNVFTDYYTVPAY